MFKLTTDSVDGKPVMQWDDVRAALYKLSPDGEGFAVLASDDGRYIQTAASPDGFTIERQDGDLDRHFRGKHEGKDQLPLSAVEAAFRVFYETRSVPANIQWEKMALKPTSPLIYGLMKLVPWIIAAYLVYLGVEIWRGSIDIWEWLT